MNGLFRPADFALDFATPMESAGAPLHHLFDLRSVASTAAHEVASVDADGRLVAHSSLRSGDAQLDVLFAKVGRVFVVDEVFLARRLVLRIVRLQLVVVLLPPSARRPSSVADEHSRGSVESVLEVVAHHPEEGQPHPARPHGARPAHSVALAFLPHLGRNVLQKEEIKNRQIFWSNWLWFYLSRPGSRMIRR